LSCSCSSPNCSVPFFVRHEIRIFDLLLHYQQSCGDQVTFNAKNYSYMQLSHKENLEHLSADLRPVLAGRHLFFSFLDYLRVWRAGEPETRLECLLNNNKNSDFCAPLTSFDWNEVDPNLLGTSSIDTTCTIWYFKSLHSSTFFSHM